MFSLIIIIYTAVDCCTLILAELGTIIFYLKKKNLDFFIDFFLSDKNLGNVDNTCVSYDCSDIHEYITTDL